MHHHQNQAHRRTKLLPALYVTVIVLALANCVREIDFSQTNPDLDSLVVSGSFTDGAGPHRLRLTRPGDVQKQYFKPVSGAQVTLTDENTGARYNYQEITVVNGDSLYYYELPQVQGIAGHVYTLEIQLPDGTIYRSRPQTLPERVPADSATVQGEWYTSVNSNGKIVTEPYAFVYVHSAVPLPGAAGRYLRWDAESVHIFNELQKIYYPIPPPQLQCYIPSRLSDQLLATADLEKYQPGALLSQQVGRRRIDNAFEHRIGICVYQRSIGREAYEYWQKVAQLITSNGTILDKPPARVYGNVENLTQPDRPALGFFELAAVDTVRVFTRDGLLGDEFLLQQKPYCYYDWVRWPPVNHSECDNCLLLKGATLQKPYWWE